MGTHHFNIFYYLKKNRRIIGQGFAWFLALGVPIAGIFIDFFNLYYRWWCLKIQNKDFAFVLVGVAFPLLLTVLSITISLSEEEICGVKKKDFSNARRGLHFSMLAMVLCSVLLMAVFDLAYFFDDWWMAIAADFSCGAFSLLFAILEIPLLVKNEYVILMNVRSMTSNDSDDASKAIGIKATKYLIIDKDVGLKKTLDRTWSKGHGSKADYLAQLLVWQKEALDEDAEASGFGNGGSNT